MHKKPNDKMDKVMHKFKKARLTARAQMPKMEKVARSRKAPDNHKVSEVMHEFKEGRLHSGSKKGPKVTNPKQAIAIGYSEARKSKKRK